MEQVTNLRFPDLALALVTGGGTLVAEGTVGLELALLLGDLAGCLVDVWVGESDLCASCLGLKVVTLLRCSQYTICA